MFFRFLTHLVFVSVFLFGSTFSCTTFTHEETGHGRHNEILQEKIPDDCCPKDGHKQQIEGKHTVQTLQKQGFDIELLTPQNKKIVHDDTAEISYQISYYQNPLYDKQSLFFTDTIRLLL